MGFRTRVRFPPGPLKKDKINDELVLSFFISVRNNIINLSLNLGQIV